MNVLFPYKTLFGDVASRIDRVHIDGEDPPALSIDVDRRAVELRGLERQNWASAGIHMEIAGPASELRTRADAGEDPQAIAVLHCGPTNARRALRLRPSDVDPSLWHGTVEIDRGHWFGRIVVRGFFTATVDGVADRVVGQAPVWTVELDDLPRSPVHGSITVTWVDFSAADVEPAILHHYAQDPWFLMLDPEEPVLFLNKAFDGLEALLGDRRRRDRPERVLHDQTRAAIASQAWVAMFNAAIGAVDSDDDGISHWPTADTWHRSVLEILIPRMFPERDHEDALQEVLELLGQADGSAAIQQRLLPAAAEHVGAPRLLRSGIRLLGTEERQG